MIADYIILGERNHDFHKDLVRLGMFLGLIRMMQRKSISPLYLQVIIEFSTSMNQRREIEKISCIHNPGMEYKNRGLS